MRILKLFDLEPVDNWDGTKYDRVKIELGFSSDAEKNAIKRQLKLTETETKNFDKKCAEGTMGLIAYLRYYPETKNIITEEPMISFCMDNGEFYIKDEWLKLHAIERCKDWVALYYDLNNGHPTGKDTDKFPIVNTIQGWLSYVNSISWTLSSKFDEGVYEVFPSSIIMESVLGYRTYEKFKKDYTDDIGSNWYLHLYYDTNDNSFRGCLCPDCEHEAPLEDVDIFVDPYLKNALVQRIKKEQNL